mmetsp:Transcript_104366/g.204701  ORF Transcript_104366/g.204701 Transcript_104366/m.204701 type:complete len:209 (-) Transcript_104366:83-709(-)
MACALLPIQNILGEDGGLQRAVDRLFANPSDGDQIVLPETLSHEASHKADVDVPCGKNVRVRCGRRMWQNSHLQQIAHRRFPVGTRDLAFGGQHRQNLPGKVIHDVLVGDDYGLQCRVGWRRSNRADLCGTISPHPPSHGTGEPAGIRSRSGDQRRVNPGHGSAVVCNHGEAPAARGAWVVWTTAAKRPRLANMRRRGGNRQCHWHPC